MGRYLGFATLVLLLPLLASKPAGAQSSAQTSPSAQAPLVVLLTATDTEPRAGFAEALRIQLLGLASLADGGWLPVSSPSARIEQALGSVELHGAVAAVWVEGPIGRAVDGGSQGDLLLFVVGRREGRALVDVLRVPTELADSADADINRSLALKVRDVLADLAAGQDVVAVFPDAPRTVPAAGRATERANRPTPNATPPARRAAPHSGDERAPNLQPLVLAGALVRMPSGSVPVHLGARLGLGARLPIGSLRLELAARVHVTPASQQSSPAGTATLSELAPGLEAMLFVPAGPVWVGGRVTAEMRNLRVEGHTASNQRATRTDHVLSVSVGPSFGIELRPGIEAWLGIDLGLSAGRRRYAVNDDVLADSGRWRAGLHLGLTLVP